ncbi:hypothetical protein ACE3NQ_04975 [Paenibacillus terreus]|uniref:Uncharacterized protein n=1 Tax=Paenibacillus terreus TaxID=1387834 RepID=A0ABV5B3K7_9BACL
MNNELKDLLRSVIKEELVPINDQLNHLKTEQESMKKEFAPINDQLNHLITEQEFIKQAVLDTNEHVVKMETILDNQHNIIELLSARSIQQEVELKRTR